MGFYSAAIDTTHFQSESGDPRMYSGPMTGNGRRRDSGSEFSQNLPDHHTALPSIYHRHSPLRRRQRSRLSSSFSTRISRFTGHGKGRPRARPAEGGWPTQMMCQISKQEATPTDRHSPMWWSQSSPRLNMIRQNSRLESNFQAGKKCCCSHSGVDSWGISR